MVVQEDLLAQFQGPGVQGAGLVVLAGQPQGDGEVVGGAEGAGVVLAVDLQVALVGPAVVVERLGEPAEAAQVGGDAAGGHQHMLVVGVAQGGELAFADLLVQGQRLLVTALGAQDVGDLEAHVQRPAVVGRAALRPGGHAADAEFHGLGQFAPAAQLAHPVDEEFPDAALGGAQRPGGAEVGPDDAVALPGVGVLGVVLAGPGRDERAVDDVPCGLPLLFGHAVPHGALHQPVHLDAPDLAVDGDQGEAAEFLVGAGDGAGVAERAGDLGALQQVHGDRLGAEVGADLEQLDGLRELAAQLSEGELPGGAADPGDVADLVVAGAAGAGGAGGRGLEFADVGAGADLGLLDAGGGLFHRDREVAEHLGDLVGVGPAAVGEPAAQMGDALLSFEHADLQGVGVAAPALGALTGDQDVSAAAGDHEVGQVARLDRVVQDQQPAAVRFPAVEGLADGLGGVGGVLPLGHAQRSGHGRELLDGEVALFGLDVPGDVVVALVAVRELAGEQRLADSAEALEEQCPAVAVAQPFADLLQ